MFEPKDFEPENNGAEQTSKLFFHKYFLNQFFVTKHCLGKKNIYANKTCLDPEIEIPCFLELPLTTTTCESVRRNIPGAPDSVIFD